MELQLSHLRPKQGMVAVAGLLLSSYLHAQLLHAPEPLPTFDVATVKPCGANDTLDGFTISMQRGFQARCMPLLQVIKFAYGVRTDAQISGDLKYPQRTSFDVDGKLSEAQATALQSLLPEQQLDGMKTLVQGLLAARFALHVHFEDRQLPVYGLVVAKNGPKLTLSPMQPRRSFSQTDKANASSAPFSPLPTMDLTSGRLQAGQASMKWFAAWLSNLPELDARTVVNETGLPGVYDFTLQWTPDAKTPQGGLPAAADSGSNSSAPSFMTAIQEQLGLKLRTEKAPVEVLIIDHLQPPSEN